MSEGVGSAREILETVDVLPPIAIGGGSVGSPISGHVMLAGAPPPEIPLPLDPTCGRLHSGPVNSRHYVLGTNGGLANVLVYVQTGAPTRFNYQPPPAVLNNTNCLFEPYVFAVLTNQPILITNSDPLLHNAHFRAKTNSEFNLALLPGPGKAVVKRFSSPELFASFKCDVHPWMFSYVSVLDHPWFAVTDQDGAFEFPLPLPPGTYSIAAIHRKAGQTNETLVVPAGQTNLPLKILLSGLSP